ncbi:hypothetical protein TNCV_1139911 [Trichonephila clavipes]|nr:hypothetical protein TNCV_1139911 [Trichonephila clavipes]
MIRNRTPERNSGCSATMTFNNALWKAAFIGIASNTNAAIMVPQIKAESVKKTTCYQAAPLHAIYSAADVDEADIITPVAVDQCAANCLGQAVLYSPPCGPGVYHRALISLSVVHFQFFELSGARRSTASKLASLRNCLAAHELLLRDRKILLSKAARSNSVSC